jgi:hypothetical protein
LWFLPEYFIFNFTISRFPGSCVFKIKSSYNFGVKYNAVRQVLEAERITFRIQVRDSPMLGQRDRDMIVLYLITLRDVN